MGEAVQVARGCIDEALLKAEGAGVEGGAWLEQQWDMRSERGPTGLRLVADERRVAATGSVSQRLAEGAKRGAGMEAWLVAEMVPEEFHEFLEVFEKAKSERLPQHRKHDLGIELLEGARVPPPGKLYQLAPAEL